MYEKNNNSLRFALTFLVLFIILMIVMLTPVQADQGIKMKIEPSDTKVNSANHNYYAIMEVKSAPAGGFFFLNVIIPAGYIFNLPPSGETIAKYTWYDKAGHSKVIIYIISNNTIAETVDVRFSTDSGRSYITKRGLPITNMVIGTTSLKFTKPTFNKVGYLNLSLGGTAGPILRHEIAKVELAKGTITNPNVAGIYTWMIEAKNSPYGTAFIASDVVKVKKG